MPSENKCFYTRTSQAYVKHAITSICETCHLRIRVFIREHKVITCPSNDIIGISYKYKNHSLIQRPSCL